MDESRRWHGRPVVVAIDGTDDGARALRYAVDEARRTGRGLRLVHVAAQTAPMAPMLPAYADRTLREIARSVLADAERHARDLTDDMVEVEAFLGHGPRVPAILDRCTDAFRVVVGQRAAAAKRFFTGSTTTGVAAHAPCPVVCVPAAWTPTGEHGPVVAGVDGSTASGAVLAVAAEEASTRRARLTVLHAWRPEGQYDAAIGSRVLADRWRTEADRGLAELAGGLADEHPDLQVDRVLAYELPRTALVDASGGAQLIVVGRTGASRPFGVLLGSVARTLIRAAECPVLVVPVSRP